MLATFYQPPRFSPAQVFPGGAAGIWLDPSTPSTAFQNNSGTAQTGTSGQPVGLRLDRRLALGAELLGGVIVPTAYTANGTVSVVGDTVTCTCTVAGNYGARFATGATTNVASWFRVAATVLSNSAAKAINLYANVTNGLGVNIGAAAGAVSGYDRSNGAGNGDAVVFMNGAIGESFSFSLASASVKRAPGNHFAQGTTSSRPLYNVAGQILSETFDGVDDGFSTNTSVPAALVNGMDLFLALKRSSTAKGVPISAAPASATQFLGAWDSAGGATLAHAGVGTAVTYWVNGVQVGGTNTTTQVQLDAALPNGTWKILELRDLDLSAWTQITEGLYTGAFAAMGEGGVIACPAQSAGNRTNLRQWLGAKVGLAL